MCTPAIRWPVDTALKQISDSGLMRPSTNWRYLTSSFPRISPPSSLFRLSVHRFCKFSYWTDQLCLYVYLAFGVLYRVVPLCLFLLYLAKVAENQNEHSSQYGMISLLKNLLHTYELFLSLHSNQ